MKKSEFENKVNNIISQQFGIPLKDITGDMNLRDMCDSLDSIELVMYIEEEFDTCIEDRLAERVVTVEDAYALIISECNLEFDEEDVMDKNIKVQATTVFKTTDGELIEDYDAANKHQCDIDIGDELFYEDSNTFYGELMFSDYEEVKEYLLRHKETILRFYEVNK